MQESMSIRQTEMIPLADGRFVSIDDLGRRTILDQNLQPMHPPTKPVTIELGDAALSSVDQTPLYYNEAATAA